MLLGFYRLYLACLKYNFSFVLDSEGYKCSCIEMVLKPNDDRKCSMTVTGRGLKELFKNAISKMKMYRAGGV